MNIKEKECINIPLHKFMHSLGLRGTELIIYALLYSFTKGEESYYYGSLRWLADSCGVSLRSVQRAVKKLSEYGLIEITEKGIRCDEEYIKEHENAISGNLEQTPEQPKYRVNEYGRYGFVGMTPVQYRRLLSLVDEDVLSAYIRRFEMMLEKNAASGVSGPHSHYRTIRKWIEQDLSP